MSFRREVTNLTDFDRFLDQRRFIRSTSTARREEDTYTLFNVTMVLTAKPDATARLRYSVSGF